MKTTAFVTMAMAAPEGSLLPKDNNLGKISRCTLTFQAERRRSRHQGGSDAAFLTPKADCLFVDRFG